LSSLLNKVKTEKKVVASLFIMLIFVGGVFFILYQPRKILAKNNGDEEINTIDTRETARIIYSSKTYLNGKPLAITGGEGYYAKPLSATSWDAVNTLGFAFDISLEVSGVKSISISASAKFVIVGKDADLDGVPDFQLNSKINTGVNDDFAFNLPTGDAPTKRTFPSALELMGSAINPNIADTILKSQQNLPYIVKFEAVLSITVKFFYTGLEKTQTLEICDDTFHLCFVNETVSAGTTTPPPETNPEDVITDIGELPTAGVGEIFLSIGIMTLAMCFIVVLLVMRAKQIRIKQK